jgi:hypothetical protein
LCGLAHRKSRQRQLNSTINEPTASAFAMLGHGWPFACYVRAVCKTPWMRSKLTI